MLLLLHANTIQSVDAGFQAPPTTLVDANSWPQRGLGAHADYGTDYESCAPSWQRLEP